MNLRKAHVLSKMLNAPPFMGAKFYNTADL